MQRALRRFFYILAYVWTFEQIANRLLNEYLGGKEEKSLGIFFSSTAHFLTAGNSRFTKGSSPKNKDSTDGFHTNISECKDCHK